MQNRTLKWSAGALASASALLVGAGLAAFFATAYLFGALDRDLLAQLRRRRRAEPVNLSE